MKGTSFFFAGVFSMTAMAQEFRPADILEWQSQSFEGQTEYKLVAANEGGVDHAVIRARCANASASGLGLERPHSLVESQILEWSWRVDDIYSGLDERRKGGCAALAGISEPGDQLRLGQLAHTRRILGKRFRKPVHHACCAIRARALGGVGDRAAKRP